MYDTKEKPVKYVGLSLDEIQKLPCLRVEGYVPETAATFFQIRSEVSETDGKTVTKTYWPYYDLNGKLTAYQGRNWTIPKSSKGHFFIVGEAKASNLQFFGQHKFTKGSYKKVIVLEGPSNIGPSWYCLNKYLTSKGLNQSYAIVSLPLGCANAKPIASSNEKWLKGAEDIILAFDNDQRSPHDPASVVKGKEATEAVYSVLLSSKVKSIDWPEHINDARDFAVECLKAGKDKDFYDLLMYGAKKYSGDKIIAPSEFSFESLEEAIPEGVYIESFPKLMGMLKGLRKNELNVWTAPTNSGKTTIVSEVAYSLMEAGQKVGIIYLEESARTTVQRFIARRLNVPANDYIFNPTKFGTPEERKAAYDWVTDGKLHMTNHFGSLRTEVLMQLINQLVYVMGCDYLIIDHLTQVIAANDDDDRKSLDKLMVELAAFVVGAPVGIQAVSHINRDNSKDQKHKDDEAYFVRVRRESMRGSASLEQLAWAVISIEPEVLPSRERGRARVCVLKNRTANQLGIADVFKMDHTTGLLHDASDTDVVKF